jgi:hypothetical protein
MKNTDIYKENNLKHLERLSKDIRERITINEISLSPIKGKRLKII